MSKLPPFGSVPDKFTLGGERTDKYEDKRSVYEEDTTDGMSSKFTGYDKSFSDLDSKPTPSNKFFTKRGIEDGGINRAEASSEAKPPVTRPTGLNEDDFNARMKNACLTGQLNVVKDILDKHYMSLTPDIKGRTPLFDACIGNQPDVIECLVKQGFDVNHQDMDGKTPLHVAMEHRHKEALKVLTELDASFTRRDNRHWMACHSAMDNGICQISNRFLKNFLGEDLATDMSWMHLQAAGHENKLVTLKILLDNNADVNHVSSAGLTALYIACRENHHDIAECLLRHGADPNSICYDGETSLHAAVSKCNHSMVLSLLQCPNIDVNIEDTHGNTALHRAVHHKETVIVSMLLEHYADPNIADRSGKSALQIAAARGCDASLIKALIAHGADPDYIDHKCRSSLFYALVKKQTESLRVLLDAGADPNIADDDGDTILHNAVRVRSSTEVLQMIIDHKAQLDIRNGRGKTALTYACVKQQKGALRVLLEAGADPNITDKDGDTILHNAVYLRSDTEVLKLIIKHSVQLDALNKKKDTALQLACDSQQNESAMLLVNSGANPNITDCKGNTPMHVAAARGTVEIVCELLEHGASINAQGQDNMLPIHASVSAE